VSRGCDSTLLSMSGDADPIGHSTWIFDNTQLDSPRLTRVHGEPYRGCCGGEAGHVPAECPATRLSRRAIHT